VRYSHYKRKEKKKTLIPPSQSLINNKPNSQRAQTETNQQKTHALYKQGREKQKASEIENHPIFALLS
jgi:hypothetical protein